MLNMCNIILGLSVLFDWLDVGGQGDLLRFSIPGRQKKIPGLWFLGAISTLWLTLIWFGLILEPYQLVLCLDWEGSHSTNTALQGSDAVQSTTFA